MNRSAFRIAGLIFILILNTFRMNCQTAIPEVLQKGTVREKMNYITEKTLIYEGYRAIREDMWQLIKNSAMDSLVKANAAISGSSKKIVALETRIDSLSSSLNSSKESLNEAVRTKNAISILGLEINKKVYNSIISIIIAVLAFIIVIGYFAYKRTFIVTRNTKKELDELKTEFEEYRKKTRLEREKMSMDHFKEIQKLKKP